MIDFWTAVLTTETAAIGLLLFTWLQIKLSTRKGVASTARLAEKSTPEEPALEVLPADQVRGAMSKIRELLSEEHLLDAGLLLARLRHTQQSKGLPMQRDDEELRPGLTCALLSSRCTELKQALRKMGGSDSGFTMVAENKVSKTFVMQKPPQLTAKVAGQIPVSPRIVAALFR